MEYTNEYDACDVLVAGGGMAGIAAAIAAARCGAKTVLVEKAGWLGGIGVSGATGLHSFFNIFDAHPSVERKRVVAGIAQELVDRVQQLGGGLGHIRMERGGDFVSMLTPVEPEVFKRAAVQLCREAGVELLLHTIVDKVRTENERIEHVVLWNKGGRSTITAKEYVDCTGDGDLAAWAGVPCEHFAADDPGAYSAGFTFRLCNVDLDRMEADLDARGVITQLAHAVKPGTHDPDLVRLGINMRELGAQGVEDVPRYFLSSSLRPRELTYCNCINYGPNDGLDVNALTTAEIVLRERMFQIADMFRENIAGCEGCYVAGPAPAVGQRRSRAVHCRYELSQEDCVTGRQFEDQIACFSFIDNSSYFVQNGGAYGIPFRALIPQGIDNLMIAGRMMTIDLVAHNSTRNTVCCLACGQAAGTGAALAAAQNTTPAALDPEAVRRTLSENSALLEPRPDPLAD